MSLISFAGKAFCRDIGASVAANGLKQLEHVELHGLIQFIIAFDAHISRIPEIFQISLLLLYQGWQTFLRL